MKYTVTHEEKSTVKIQMTFTGEEWESAINGAYLKNRKRYVVNGFRKGKVPKHVVEMYYGKGVFYEDALGILFDEHYPEILKKEEENFTEVGTPSLSVDEIEADKVVLSAVVPVKPDVKIETYKGIKIAEVEYTVTDEAVEAEIKRLLTQAATTEEVTDRAAEDGDTVTIDFLGKVDGTPFEGGEAKGYDLTLGSHSFIAGFEEQVVGMKIGETKDLNVTFPEDYQAEALKGKAAVFTVTLHAIKAKVLPPLDEEFAKKMGSDSVEAFRTKVTDRLQKSAESRSRNETEFAILEAIAKGATAEIPEAMIDRQEDVSMQRMEYNLMYQGIRMEDYLSYIGTTKEAYKKNFEEEARRTVLQQLILEKIMKEEKIEATAEEIEEKIAEQAKSVGKEAKEYEKTMDPRQREYIESDIKVTKTFAFLRANNEMVKEVKKI